MPIRIAVPADAPAISELLGQLGYPAPVPEITPRLRALSDFPSASAFVATDRYGEVVGVVTAHLIPSIHDNEPVAWLTTLVVQEDARGAGIGSALVEHIEKWATNNGARRLSVTSAMHRKEAHEFYEKRGYENTGLRFGKSLPAGGR